VEKIITKNGESYVAPGGAGRLDYYHRLEQERVHLLINDAQRGLADITAVRTYEAESAIAQMQLQLRRSGEAAKGASSGAASEAAKKRG
jgi:hypothetical protein